MYASIKAAISNGGRTKRKLNFNKKRQFLYFLSSSFAPFIIFTVNHKEAAVTVSITGNSIIPCGKIPATKNDMPGPAATKYEHSAPSKIPVEVNISIAGKESKKPVNKITVAPIKLLRNIVRKNCNKLESLFMPINVICSEKPLKTYALILSGIKTPTIKDTINNRAVI